MYEKVVLGSKNAFFYFFIFSVFCHIILYARIVFIVPFLMIFEKNTYRQIRINVCTFEKISFFKMPLFCELQQNLNVFKPYSTVLFFQPALIYIHINSRINAFVLENVSDLTFYFSCFVVIMLHIAISFAKTWQW